MARTKHEIEKKKKKRVVETTGKEWNQFEGDADFWGEDRYYQDLEMEIDGELHDEGSDLLGGDLPDGAKVKILGGTVTGDDEAEDVKLIDFFLDWQRTQTHARYVIDVPKDKVAEFESEAHDIGVIFITEPTTLKQG